MIIKNGGMVSMNLVEIISLGSPPLEPDGHELYFDATKKEGEPYAVKEIWYGDNQYDPWFYVSRYDGTFCKVNESKLEFVNFREKK